MYKRPLVLVLILLWSLLFWWSVTFTGWKDPDTRPLSDNRSEDYFDDKARPIVHENGSDTAVLFVHGFMASPYIWTYLAERANEAGYDVYAPALPAHGTSLKAYEQTYFTQWYEWLTEYYQQLRLSHKHLFVIGHSMGGAMTLKLAEDYCDTPFAPDGIITISAPAVYNSFRDGVLTQPLLFLVRPLGVFFPHWIGTKAVAGKKAWPESDGHEVWTGYEGLSYKQAASFLSQLPDIRSRLPLITCPILTIHDDKDRTVSPKNLKVIMAHVSSTDKQSWLTSLDWTYLHTHHCLPLYHAIQEELSDAILGFMEAHDE